MPALHIMVFNTTGAAIPALTPIAVPGTAGVDAVLVEARILFSNGNGTARAIAACPPGAIQLCFTPGAGYYDDVIIRTGWVWQPDQWLHLLMTTRKSDAHAPWP